ncbi:MAG: hypothetical protein V7642_6647 [Burkholderiales bacterium]
MTDLKSPGLDDADAVNPAASVEPMVTSGSCYSRTISYKEHYIPCYLDFPGTTIMTLQIVPIFFACLIWGIINAALAKTKRRRLSGWFALGFCFWFFPLLVLPFLRKLPRPEFDVAVFPSTNFPHADFPDTSLSNSRFL